MPHSREWVLYAGEAPEAPEPVALAPWVQALASRPRITIGELEDSVLIEGVVPTGWQCSVLPEYINPHTLVAAMAVPGGEYAMLFLSKVGAEFRQQERPVTPGLLGWFHIRLFEPVTDERSLEANLNLAHQLLQSRGVFVVPFAPGGDA